MPAHSLNPRAGPFHTPLPAYDYYSKTTKKIFILSALCERIILAAIPKKNTRLGKMEESIELFLFGKSVKMWSFSSRGWRKWELGQRRKKRS
jgi:hypothetical protein